VTAARITDCRVLISAFIGGDGAVEVQIGGEWHALPLPSVSADSLDFAHVWPVQFIGLTRREAEKLIVANSPRGS